MMKRSALCALWSLPALAALCGPAQAQSNVTISGFLDLGVFRGFDDVKQVGTIQRSNIAFSGSEDLGGGLAATFMLSKRFEMDTGQLELAGKKPYFHGESTVGLKGAFGHVRLGRALDVIYALDWAYDPWYNFNRIASPAWYLWHYNYASDRTSNNGSPEFGRLSNGLFYDSPSMAGVTVHLSGSFEDSFAAPGSGTGNNFGASLNYDRGPVSLMLARSRNTSGDTVVFVAGKYTFGALQLMAAYDTSTFKGVTSDSDADTYTVGAVYSLGAVALKAGYGKLDVDGDETNFIGLGADYAVSKRTTVYFSAGRNDPDNANSSNAYGVGISHSF
jgi:predicted porin